MVEQAESTSGIQDKVTGGEAKQNKAHAASQGGASGESGLIRCGAGKGARGSGRGRSGGGAASLGSQETEGDCPVGGHLDPREPEGRRLKTNQDEM